MTAARSDLSLFFVETVAAAVLISLCGCVPVQVTDAPTRLLQDISELSGLHLQPPAHGTPVVPTAIKEEKRHLRAMERGTVGMVPGSAFGGPLPELRLETHVKEMKRPVLAIPKPPKPHLPVLILPSLSVRRGR